LARALERFFSARQRMADTSWESKELTLKEVPSKIRSGSHVYIGSAASTAEAILSAIVDTWQLRDVQIIQMLPGGNLPHLQENIDRFRTYSFFSFTKTAFYKAEHREGLADYIPISISAIPRLLQEGKLTVDVAIIKVTKPHKGFCSLGLGVECTRDFIKHAKTVIAQVTSHMPWTEGHSKISTQQIDWWVRNDDEPLKTTRELWPDFMNSPYYSQDILDGIGKNLVKEINDGATLKFGWSPVTHAVFPFLHSRKNLGLHTDILVEELFKLQEAGVITNTEKTIDTGRTVVSQAHGSQELYEFVDRNPAIEFQPSSYINDHKVMSRIDNLVTIVGALKVDLTGQVATDSIAHKFYGGVWSVDDSIRGARFSKGGKPIVALPSKSLQGRSNIVFALPSGTGVSVTRSDVEYVVTEYGTAYLYGKSIRERCLALIDIAHPDYRHELLEQAKQHHYISESQPGNSVKSTYPQEFECVHTTRKGQKVFVRPIKAIDEDMLRSFFHKLSDHSVYLRYFRRMPSMPQRILQKFTDVDYSSDMALIALSPHDSSNPELVGIAQWISDPHDGIPEVAFQVRDDWQAQGLGSFLFLRLVEMSKFFGVSQFKADVLVDNRAMRRVFERANVPHTCRTEFGVTTYVFSMPQDVTGN
jgi:acyl-CoA hydrolase/RimJ/RimL family protein N-acetyltransferase